MQSSAGLVVVLGTGGTIAGTAARPQDHTGYTAGALKAADLVAAVPALAALLADLAPLVRGHAAWALRRIGGEMANAALAAALTTEDDPAVVREMAG